MSKKKPESAEIRKDLFPSKYVELKFNATKAAIACGYSEKAARQTGTRLMSDAAIQAEIHELVQGIKEETKHSRDRLLQEIGYIAYLNPVTLFDENGEFRHIKDMPESTQRAIAGIAMSKGKTMRDVVSNLKMCSKERALEMLAKFEKLYSDAPVIAPTGDVVFNMVLQKGEDDDDT